MPLTNASALVVEADAHCLMTLSALLKEVGVAYKRNTTGAQVISQLRDMHTPPNFIFIDIDLPQGNATTICRAIKLEPRFRDISVIALGDESIRQYTSELIQAGFAGCFIKPFPRKALREKLISLLRGESLWENVN